MARPQTQRWPSVQEERWGLAVCWLTLVCESLHLSVLRWSLEGPAVVWLAFGEGL